MALAVRVITA
jgi:hypothetical protein